MGSLNYCVNTNFTKHSDNAMIPATNDFYIAIIHKSTYTVQKKLIYLRTCFFYMNVNLKLPAILFFFFLSAYIFGQDAVKIGSSDVLDAHAALSETDEEHGEFANYFSFHGEDENGKVYFALDNDRHKKKNKPIKASNFLYFNVDGEFISLRGHGDFKSEEKDIEKCFDSEDFVFNYSGDELKSIVSPTNGIKIIFETDLLQTGRYGEGEVLFDMFAAKATLEYQGRTFVGNLISERFTDRVGLKSFSNITNVLFKGFKYDGFYLNVRDFGDLYVHLVSPEETINIFTDNVYNVNTDKGAIDFDLQKTDYKVTKFKRVGFKKLPLEIEIDLGNSKLTLYTTHFKKYRNLLFFKMSSIKCKFRVT